MNVQSVPVDRARAMNDPYARYGVPDLGFRNYWYPALLTRQLGAKPKRVVLLGEPVVIWREGKSMYALADRCAHRGARLSRGRCEFPGSGTISCPYHGWTYEGRTGKAKAALMEGPRAEFGPRAGVKAYPVEERAGIIWVFVGEMDAVPLADDVPEWLLKDDWFSISVTVRYSCNWRALIDNWAQDWHANYVHRNSPEFFLQPAPFARDMIVAEIPGKKGVGYLDVGGVDEAEFAGLGKWPHDRWHRVMKPKGLATVWFDSSKDAGEVQDGSKFLKQLRLPGYIMIGRGHRKYWLCQFATPIDNNTTMLFNINIFQRKSRWSEVYDRIHYAVFRGWAHDWLFSGQDKRILDDWEVGPELLSKTDMGVLQWRKFSTENARRPGGTASVAN